MNHLGKVLCISSLVIAAMAITSFGQGWGYGPVLVFDQRDGNGNVSSFGVGEYRNNRGEFGTLRNDSAYSVSVPSGFRVRFCDNEGSRGEGSGRCEEYGEGNANLRYGGTASYVRVLGPSGWNGNNGWNGGGQRGVTVYEDRDFTGRSQDFGIGRYLNVNGGLGNVRNDKASSVVVNRGFRVRLCENEGDGLGSGRCEDYGEGRYNLRYNDSVSFVEVQRSGPWGGWNGGGGGFPGGGNPDHFNDRVTVFAGINQLGVRQTFTEGVYRFIDGQFGRLQNDTASSVYVPNGYRVKLCENEGRGPYGERCEEFGPGDHNLRFQNLASSVEVRRGNYGGWELGNTNTGGWNGGGGGYNDRGVIVYVDRDQRGTSQFFDAGVFRADQGQLGNVGNDRASSVWVANGYHVQFCESEPRGFFGNVAQSGSGRCEEYGPGRYNLRYNDTASYIRVWVGR